MSFPLKATLAVLGAVCVLLLAGAFPLLGAEGVYRGGAMLLAGLAVLLLSLWGAWRLAAGRKARLCGGLICLFFAGAGVVILWQYSTMAIRMAQQGGPMWAGAVAMSCTALTGCIFTGVFGYLVLKTMDTARLWLAGAHLSLALLLCGAYADFCWEKRAVAELAAGSGEPLQRLTTTAGETAEPGFSLLVDRFTVTHYDEPTYTLYTMQGGQPTDPRPAERRGDRLVFGAESCAVSELHTAPGMPHPFVLLPGEPPRVILQNAPAVKDYAAECTLHTTHRGRPETRHDTLRVNAPLECKGWLISLVNYTETPHGPRVQLLFRRAPGRIPTLTGIVGILLCLIGAFTKRDAQGKTSR